VLVFRAPLGSRVEPGQEIADVVDPLTERVVTLRSSITGVLYARHRTRFVTAGMEVAWTSGAKPIRSGSLLPE
jgi:predicted deacylase